jgi:hypothetical protein
MGGGALAVGFLKLVFIDAVSLGAYVQLVMVLGIAALSWWALWHINNGSSRKLCSRRNG